MGQNVQIAEMAKTIGIAEMAYNQLQPKRQMYQNHQNGQNDKDWQKVKVEKMAKINKNTKWPG